MVVDPTGKLLTKRKTVSRKDVIANPRVTKFKHLVRRARSSHQAQLREMKQDTESEDEEQSQSDDDGDAAISILAEHDDEGWEFQQLCGDPASPYPGFERLWKALKACLHRNRWAKDDSGEATDEEPEEDEKKRKKTKKKKAKAPAKSKASKAKAQQDQKNTKKDKQTSKKKENSSSQEQGEETEAMQRMKRTMTADCAYVPGSYKEARLRYIAKKRERGFSWKEACEKWNQSSARASWLEGLSVNELKRRRFI
ncbi:unnamed protein product [Symbiodinium sp. CCMP2592]|nr:unnamed protein product [Symbiodinium sp. CCMP2592]